MRAARLLLLLAVVAPGLVVAPAGAIPRKLTATMRAEDVQPVPGPVGAKGTAKIEADSDIGRAADPNVLDKSVEVPPFGAVKVSDLLPLIVEHLEAHADQVRAILRVRGALAG